MLDEDLKVVSAMIRFGGSFVKSLGNAFIHADPVNFIKLKKAFPEYWDQYSKTNLSTTFPKKVVK